MVFVSSVELFDEFQSFDGKCANVLMKV